MKKLSLIILSLLICFGIFVPQTKAAPSDRVYVVDVEGKIDKGLTRFIEKSIDTAENHGARAIIFNINTFGGLVDSGVNIRDLIVNTNIETIALVNDRAWSAGALVALACDKLYMAPGSSMGAAETRPNEEKYISAFAKEFKATAEIQNRNPDIAAAMVDADIVIEGITEKGKLVTLTANEAVELEMADGKLAGISQIASRIGASDGVIKKLNPALADKFIRYITDPVIGGILIIIGFVGLLVEGVVPGWGVPGSIGVLAFASFYGGNLLVGNTSWGIILLFVAAIILLGLEIFVVPGFGITGISGFILLAASILLTFDNLAVGLYALSLAIILGTAAVVILLRMLGSNKNWNKIALTTSQNKEEGYMAPGQKKELLDHEGETITPLRPSGIARINGERVNVVSRGDYIPKGRRIKVIKIEGTRAVVREIEG